MPVQNLGLKSKQAKGLLWLELWLEILRPCDVAKYLIQLKGTHVHTQKEHFVTIRTSFPKFLGNRLTTFYKIHHLFPFSILTWVVGGSEENNDDKWRSLLGSVGIEVVYHTKLQHQLMNYCKTEVEPQRTEQLRKNGKSTKRVSFPLIMMV